MIGRFFKKIPTIGNDVFVADSAVVLGDVAIGDRSSIWYGTVVRGDVHEIRIGESTNVQDRCVIHVSAGTHPTRIGDQVTIGHGAIIHGCIVGDRSLVGIGAIILDGAEVGEGSLVAAGSLVPPGKKYPARSMLVGSPAQVKRTLTDEEVKGMERSAEHYCSLAQQHLRNVIDSPESQ